MTKQETIFNLCNLCSEVNSCLTKRLRCDCFCCEEYISAKKIDDKIITFIENAVREKLARRHIVLEPKSNFFKPLSTKTNSTSHKTRKTNKPK